jgi:hypothetical protein
MSGFDNETVYANNWDFRGTQPVLPQVNASGQLPIGTGGSPAILVGSLVSPNGSITIGYSSPNITLELAGGTIAFDSITVDTTTASGVNPVVPTAAGLVTFSGGQYPSGTFGTRVIDINSQSPNNLQILAQISATNASSLITKNGICHFDSSQFTVDANGFVQVTGDVFIWSDASGAFSPLKTHGYFITGTATGTLPASPVQGDTIEFFVDHASQLLTIKAPGTQIIRLGTLVSSAGGTAISTQQGDSVALVYRSSDTCWCAVGGFTGTWTMA